MRMRYFLSGIFCGFTLQAAPEIDTTPERARIDLKPGLERIGTIRPRSTLEIKSSNWTVGCETVDRDYTDYHAYKTYLEALGIKKIRFQAGWAKCEKERGVYDFQWLDEIVADAAARGIELWLQVSYGNTIYPGGGPISALGSFPTSAEALAAWDKWVEALASRYKGRVREWEIWNEPNHNRANTPQVVADFNVRSARIIKKVDPSAKIAGLAVGGLKDKFFDDFLKRVQEQGGLDLFTWFSYHSYPRNPDDVYEGVAVLREILKKYPTQALLRQGESGCPSELLTGRASLSNYAWTELTQAKWDLRRMLGDLGHDVESSIFGMIDMYYPTSCNRKGLLRAAPDKQVEKIKLAYYAVQNMVAIFDHNLVRLSDELVTTECAQSNAPCFMYAVSKTMHRRHLECAQNQAYNLYQHKASGQQLVAVWDRKAIPAETNLLLPVNITIEKCTIKEPVWVDLISGGVYAFPPEAVIRSGDQVVFKNVPVYDAPILLAERALVLR